MAADSFLVIDALDSQGRGLRLRLARAGDRLRHEIAAAAGGREETLLRSIEGDGGQRWPASPPFQEAAEHEIAAGRRAALLVGMAGKSHWSASVEAAPDARRLVFDVACRLIEPPERLGSAYLAAGAVERCDDQAILLVSAATGLRVVVRVEAGAALRLDSPDQVDVVAQAGPDAPATIRWRYAVAWSDANESSAATGSRSLASC